MTSCSKGERWLDIPGYEGRYQVSDLGRVRSVDHRVRVSHGATRLMRGRVLKPAGSKRDPHLYVVLGHGAHGSPVHHLVALAFLGPCPEGCEVRHLDGDPLNNRAENLAYGSRAQNILDVFRIGRAWRKLTAAQALEIRERLARGERGVDLAREFGVTPSSISAIKTGRRFSWLKNES